MTEPFSEDYYCENGQDKDRPALCFYQRLASHFLCGGAVLDFGCGPGWFLRRLGRRRVVCGVELSDYARMEAAKNNPGVLVYENLSEVPSRSCSGITALHVFEHLDNVALEQAMAEFRRILEPRGRILCVVPQLEGRGHRLKQSSWSGFKDATHVNLKSGGDWQEYFEAQGFSLVAKGTDGLWDFPYSRLPRLLDLLIFGSATVFQFIIGRLVIPWKSGESLVAVIQKKNISEESF